MKRFCRILVCLFLSANLAGCLTVPSWLKPRRPQYNGAIAEALPAYSGPKARIILADFAVTPARAASGTGAGLRRMLAEALSSSNHFSLAERQPEKPQIQGAKQPLGPEEAPLIISVTVKEFQPQPSGGSAGLGGGGGVTSGALGGLLGRPSNKAHISLEVRVVNAATSERILAAHKLQAQAADISGNIMADAAKSWPLAGELSAYSRTPMEKAIRLCLAETVRYLTQSIPAEYYKY